MQQSLKEKLEKLAEKCKDDLDVISLKTLYEQKNTSTTYTITTISDKIIKLTKRYSENKEIKSLLPTFDEIYLNDFLEILEQDTNENTEDKKKIKEAIKEMFDLPEGEDKKNYMEVFVTMALAIALLKCKEYRDTVEMKMVKKLLDLPLNEENYKTISECLLNLGKNFSEKELEVSNKVN